MFSVQHALTVNNASDTFDATSGTLSIAGGRTLKINTGAVALGSTALSGTGTLDVTGDVLALAGNQTLTAAGVQMILTNATVNGPGTLTNASGNTLTLSNTKVNAAAGQPGDDGGGQYGYHHHGTVHTGRRLDLEPGRQQ